MELQAKGGSRVVTGVRKVKTFAELVRFEHTVFNLPFAYLGAFVAAKGWPGWSQMLWITVAMVGARTASMAMNRLFDSDIDARTPRTKGRHIPAGLVAKKDVRVLIGASLVLLLLAAFNLNSLCIKLFPLAVLTVGIYSFTKRFTWLCHLFLGLGVAWAPFGAYVAVSGKITVESLLLVAIVTLWNTGFDIPFAILDMEADRVNGVYSVPARFGVKGSLLIARFLHLIVMGSMLYLGWYSGLVNTFHPTQWTASAWVYLAGWAAVAGLLHYEHSIVSPRDLSRLNAAFFNVNAYVSIVYFLFTTTAILIK